MVVLLRQDSVHPSLPSSPPSHTGGDGSSFYPRKKEEMDPTLSPLRLVFAHNYAVAVREAQMQGQTMLTLVVIAQVCYSSYQMEVLCMCKCVSVYVCMSVCVCTYVLATYVCACM